MIKFYNEWNKDGAKNLQVIVISGDKNEAEWKNTMNGAPWVAIPFDKKTGDSCKELTAKVPCTGYPTPGVMSGKNFAVFDPDCFGKVDEANYKKWMSEAAK